MNIDLKSFNEARARRPGNAVLPLAVYSHMFALQ